MLKFDCTLSNRRFLISGKRVGSFFVNSLKEILCISFYLQVMIILTFETLHLTLEIDQCFCRWFYFYIQKHVSEKKYVIP